MRKRISKKERERISELVIKKRSLINVSRSMGMGIPSLYYHYNDLNPRGLPESNIEINCHEYFGEFLGIFAGDGYANVDDEYHYQVRIFFNIKDVEYIDYVESLLIKLFKKKPFRIPRREYSVVVLKYNSKDVFDILMEYFIWDVNGKGSKSRTIRLKKNIDSRRFKIGFLRGCLDSDGYVNTNKIEYATASPFLSISIRRYLDDLELPHTYYLRKDKRSNRAPMHIININKTNRLRFFDLIRPVNAPRGKSSLTGSKQAS